MAEPRLIAQTVAGPGEWSQASDRLTLSYDDRFLRRKQLATDGGLTILVDFEQARSLGSGDALVLSDSRLVEIEAAQEPLTEITGPELQRYAWHIGNRHAPCQIETARLLIQRNPVMAEMLAHLGATVKDVTEAFTPEGGAYGHGRTHGHSHD